MVGAAEGAGRVDVTGDRAGKAVAGLATGSSRFETDGARAKAARSDTLGGTKTLAPTPADGAQLGAAAPRAVVAIAAGAVLGAARRVGAADGGTAGVGCATSRRRSP
jgi:hypothetical protein